MIVKFIEIKDDSGYYDPSAINPNTGQKGIVMYGWNLREVFVDATNISHFCIDVKMEACKENICSQLDLSRDASYTKIFFKQGTTSNMTVVATTDQIVKKLQGK